MNSGRTLLVGGSGWIGSRLARVLPNVELLPARALAEGSYVAELRLSPHDVVVNAAGRRSGDEGDLYAANVTLVKELVSLADRGGCRVVQLGSAAEYGPGHHSPLSESTTPHPVSYYGVTKLIATEILQSRGNSTTLRIFNIASNPPQTGSPLADVLSRFRAGVAAGRPVELLAPATVRDWVALDFVVQSVARAVAVPTPGVFNICSGRGISMRELAEAMLQSRDAGRLGVRDLHAAEANTVIGDDRRWRSASGLSQPLGPADVASIALNDQGSVDQP
ncbi:MAG: SDR family oxidoreductase [Candidatus Nanopelagicales bacterium]